MLQPKLEKMLVFDSTDFEKKNIRRIPIHPKNVSKIVISYIYFFIYRIGHHTKASIYKKLFIYFFHKITELTSTIFSKEEFIPQIDKKKW